MKKIMLVVLTVVVVIIGGCSARFYSMGKESKNTSSVGLVNSALQACPNRPSCVLSTDNSKRHGIDALVIPEGVQNPMDVLAKVINDMPNTKIISQEEGYVHATFTSKLFRFVDDVELLLDGQQVHVRSVSRVGYSDLGANRKRVEAIRKQFK